MAGQLHHVVGTGALGGVGSEFGGELARIRVPGFAVARRTSAIRTLADDFLPEIFSDVPIAPVAGEFVITGCSNRLWDVRVHMQAFEFVAVSGKRIKKCFLVEALRDLKIVLLACDRAEIA